MEGYLPMGHAIAWGALCLPFLVAGFISIKKTISQHRKALLILAMAGAYAFVLSALKIPSVTGSSSHPTGTGLGAILFGPSAMSVIGIIVLLFQALLLAHGGLTTLGANTFSMAIAGPFLSYGIYRLGRKLKINKSVCVFLATCLGDLFTYWQGLPEGQLDLIVSNPPYLTAEEMRHLQPEVAQEPAMALEAGKDGLVFYRALAEHYQNALRPGGALVLEIGWQQRQAVAALLAANGWADIECRKDFGGNDRCMIAHRPEK